MTFKIVEGDLFECAETFLCHQCNCVTNRSAHLAKAVFARFPYADIYTPRKTPDNPGTIIISGDGATQRFVINMLGQYYPGRCKYPNSKKDGYPARQGYFQSCLKQMEKLTGSFAFPWRIGCGAAGGYWDDYLEDLKEFEANIEGDVVIYKLKAYTEQPEPRKLF